MTALYLVLGLLLLLLNGFFVAAEFALVAGRRTKIEQLAQEGDKRARIAADAMGQVSLMLSGVQLGITMASLGLGAVAEPALAHLIGSAIEGIVHLSPTVVHSISFVVALTLVVFLHMVIGEMAPKNIALSQPERSALVLARPLKAYVAIFRPFIALSNGIANWVLRLFRVEPRDEILTASTAQEIAVLIAQSAEQGVLDRFEHRLLSGAIGFGDRDARSVMVPRTEMTAVPLLATPQQLEQIVLETGHSRIPVYAQDLDQILGFFHAKDLLRIEAASMTKPLDRRFIREMLVVPDSRKLHPLMFDMRRERRHFALVIDEHGGTAGVVTLEDLLEELVGEIQDEHDITELGVQRIDENTFVLPGGFRVDDAAERLGIPLPEGDYETVAGFLMERLGRIPKRRDVVEHEGWRLRVRTMHRRRVVEVLAERLHSAGD